MTFETLRTVLGRAVTKGILASNPFSSLEPRYKRPASVKRFTWSRETIKAILDAARLHSSKKTTLLNYLPYVAVLAYTGLRAGEGLALTWGDIDLLNGRLTVRGTLRRDMTIGSAKTAASHRTIPIPSPLVDILVEAKPLDAEDNWFVLASRFAPTKPVSYNNLRSRGWTQILKLADLSESGITLHSLRHATASLLIDSGLAPTDVAEHLGHANAGLTMAVYAHEFGTCERREARIKAAFEEQMTACADRQLRLARNTKAPAGAFVVLRWCTAGVQREWSEVVSSPLCQRCESLAGCPFLPVTDIGHTSRNDGVPGSSPGVGFGSMRLAAVGVAREPHRADV